MVARRFWGGANDCLVFGNKTYMLISATVGFFMRVCVDLIKVSGDFTQHSGRLFQPCPMEMHSNVNDGDVNTGWLLGTRPNNMRIDFGQVRNVQYIQFWKNADQSDNVAVG